MVVLLNFLFVFCNKQNTQRTLTGSVALCIRSERRFVFQVTPSRFRIVNVVATTYGLNLLLLLFLLLSKQSTIIAVESRHSLKMSLVAVPQNWVRYKQKSEWILNLFVQNFGLVGASRCHWSELADNIIINMQLEKAICSIFLSFILAMVFYKYNWIWPS